SAHSEGLGHGAEFTVHLPLAPGDEPRAASERLKAVGAAAARVLVVEDAADAADLLRELLELSGYTVEVACSGAAALQAAGARPPDVVLCDIGLPGLNGYEVARALRADAGLSSAALIALSGYDAAEHRLRMRE